MPTTPPSSKRNAITAPSITPICPKTSSVPLDGRSFKAATLDAELATELENATIYEQAGLQDNYIAHWCQLSDVAENLSQVQARSLKHEDIPLFVSGCWEPSVIPALLRQPVSEVAVSSSDSNTRKSKSLRSFLVLTRASYRQICLFKLKDSYVEVEVEVIYIHYQEPIQSHWQADRREIERNSTLAQTGGLHPHCPWDFFGGDRRSDGNTSCWLRRS